MCETWCHEHSLSFEYFGYGRLECKTIIASSRVTCDHFEDQ
jgi:YD repeat-containing protein